MLLLFFVSLRSPNRFKWTPYWLNEREMARRPWLYQEQYMRIDKLLAELAPDFFGCRKLDSEYATLLLNHDRGPGSSSDTSTG